jgi:site-specific DNA recombinase
MLPKSLRCAIYARHSPKPEGAAGDNFSIASQIHEAKALALKEFGCANPDVYTDKDVSGATLDRPELDRLRDALALKLYDVVIPYSPDRWTRDRFDGMLLDKEVAKAGARLAFVSGSYADTPEGHLAKNVQDAVSEYERAKFRERSRRCRRQKSLEGHPHSCSAPDGYIYRGHKFGIKGSYVKVESRAKIVHLIFQRTAEGFTNSRLAKWLNTQGILTQKGKRWARNSVAQVLAKRCYTGELIQNGERIEIPEIVSRELWDQAHEALKRNRIGRVGRPPREYLLSGLLWCRRCGKRCSTFPFRDNAYYRCKNIDLIDRNIRYCHAPGIRKVILEPVIWNAVWDTVCDPRLLWQMIEAYYDRVAGLPKTKKDPATARIERARRQVARAEEILKDGDALPYAQAKANLEAARKELAEAQLGGPACLIQMPQRKDVEAVSKHLRAMREELAEFPDRREALSLLVEKILYADGEAEIHCRLPKASDAVLNCHSRITDDGNLIGSIPFIITRRVA